MLPGSNIRSAGGPSQSDNESTSVGFENSSEEFELLDGPQLETGVYSPSHDHELRTAPIFTREAFVELEYAQETMQYGVLGSVLSVRSKASIELPEDRRLYVNTNAPFSALVCGVQGSGKSHSVAVLLESMLIPNCRAIGSLNKPLSCLVLHLGEGGRSSRPSEAAWLGVPRVPSQDMQHPSVHVFVSASSLDTMRSVYGQLGSAVTVQPLRLHESELDAASILSLMAVGSSSSAPLYIQVLLSILRDLGENYTYKRFIAALESRKCDFNPAQLSGLEQRMFLIQSFIDNGKTRQKRFAAGMLTIIDMSDPFIDAASACGIFEIVTRLFVRAQVDTGKVLVVDEAHKYLTPKKDIGLTSTLLTLVREQRHLALRVIISTQEPTVVPPVLLDLCTVAILHRFSSPSWWSHVAEHVSADVSSHDAFDNIVRLKTGEAILLAPSALAFLRSDPDSSYRRLSQLGRRYLLMKTRKRVTADGGASVLVL